MSGLLRGAFEQVPGISEGQREPAGLGWAGFDLKLETQEAEERG